jgi:beta-aspartyl-peptidase (threonine type)
VTEQRVKQLEDAISKNEVRLDHSGTDEKEKKFGTVGAVAMDIKGNLAAATSTGGIVNKKYGRVGDTPIIGAGTIADNNSVAVSCTGFGEQFIKVSFAKRLADYVELLNMNAQEASEKTVEDLINKVNGLGGSISIDKNGNIGIAHSSPCILFGLSKDGYKMVGVSREDLQK